jgi:hypothetical protein
MRTAVRTAVRRKAYLKVHTDGKEAVTDYVLG